VLGIKGRNGAFAQYLTLPLANLYAVPDTVTDEAAVFTEPLAAALQILEQVHVQPHHRVMVIGAGRLGQLIARALSTTAANLSVVARYDTQRQRLERWGIPVLAEAEVPVAEIDVAVEATGSPAGLALARKVLRPRGTLVLKSTYQGEVSLDMSSLVVDEIHMIGSRCGPFEPALRVMAQRKVDPTDLIDETYPLSQGLEAFTRAGQKGVLKVLLAP
jgi:threonine dehydrogenase-like Zn-dependent dehydrogenase